MRARIFGRFIIDLKTLYFTLAMFALGVNLSFGQENSFNQENAKNLLKNCILNKGNCDAQQDSVFELAKTALTEEAYAQFIMDISYTHFLVSDFEESFAILKDAESVAQNLNNDRLFAECYKRLSQLYFYEGDMDTAATLAERSLELFTALQDSAKMGKGVLYRGQITKERGHYTEALEDYFLAFEIFENLKDTENMAIIYGEMSTIYAMSGENDKAIQYGRKAAKIFKRLSKQESNYAYAIVNLANNLSFANRPDTAILLLNEAIPIFERDGDLYLQINAIAQMSRAHYKKGEILKALQIMKKANALDPEMQYTGQSIYNFQLMGRMYRDIEAWPSAIKYYRKSYVLHQKIGFNDELKPLLEDLVVAYDTIGQIDSAYKFLQEVEIVKDSLYSIEKTNKLNELKAQYEADLKEEQLRNNAREIELLEQSNTVKTQRNINLVIILIVVLALTISIIGRQRHRMRVNKLLATESEKTHQAELQAKAAEREKLEEDLKRRQQELASQALLIAEKNELLRSFRSEVEKVSEAETKAKGSLKSISRQMERAENQQGDWDKFMALFKDVHPTLLSKLAQTNPDLTHNDIRLLALMKMGFSNKEISDILHVTEESLKKARYRLRKKLNLEPQASIHQFIQNI